MFSTIRKRRLEHESDEELMSIWVRSRRTGGGDTSAFEILWNRHADATYGIAVRVLGPHRALADEVLQDVWTEVTRAVTFQPQSFRAFIRTIATRKALDLLSTAALRTSTSISMSLAEEDAHEVPAPLTSGDPGRGLEAREGAAMVLKIAERMPDTQRGAWTMRYVEQRTFEEIAEVMETPVGTAKTRVRLADAFLAKALDAVEIDRADLVAHAYGP